MASFYGGAGNDAYDGTNISGEHFLYGRAGSDTLRGGSSADFIYGEGDNDFLYGGGGADNLIGGSGNDVMYGGTGDDFFFESVGNDSIVGGIGNDTMWGCSGNDYYYHYAGDGNDIVNDNKTATGGVGGGGTADRLIFGYSSAEVLIYSSGNDYLITSTADVADGFINDSVLIQGQLLGGNNKIEYLQLSDGVTFIL